MIKRSKGITLIALVVTIIILLISAGVTIASLGGENGLITKVNQAKKAQIKAEMKEQLILALNDLQLEKAGKATLDDITQEWIDEEIKDYECIITEDANGLLQVEYLKDGHIEQCNGKKSVSRDCIIQLGEDEAKTVPSAITKNGKYTFIATGIYNGKTITKEIEITVNKYKSATGLGTTNYDGWQILEGEIRVGKKYVKKLVHAGTPENFVYNFTDWGIIIE